MNKIIDIDKEDMTATVESGVVWQNLEGELSKRGLTLRTYPSSSDSTVGGWVAQGGNGYGGYEYGDFRQNIVSVDVVLPTGELKSFSGSEIDKVYSLCGITGLIVKVVIKVRELDEESVMLAAFTNMTDITNFLTSLTKEKLPIWNISLATPSYTALKQKASQHYALPDVFGKYKIHQTAKNKSSTPVSIIS